MMNPTALPLADQVIRVVTLSPYLNQSGVEVETQDGEVTIRGTVSSYYQKQMAQESLRDLEGVNVVKNDLEVDWNE